MTTAVAVDVEVAPSAPKEVTPGRAARAGGLVERCATARQLWYKPLRSDPRLGGLRPLERQLTRVELAVDGFLQVALAEGWDGARVTVEEIARRVRASERAVHYALRALGPCCGDGADCALPGHTAHRRRTCRPCEPGCERHLGRWQRVPQFDDVEWCSVTLTPEGRLAPGRRYYRRQTTSCITPVRATARTLRHANGNANANANASRERQRVTRTPGLRSVPPGCNDCTPTTLPPQRGGRGGEVSSKPRVASRPKGAGCAGSVRPTDVGLSQATQATATATPEATRSLAPDGGRWRKERRERAAGDELAAAALAAQAARETAKAARAEREAALLKARLERAERATRPLDEIRPELDPELDFTRYLRREDEPS